MIAGLLSFTIPILYFPYHMIHLSYWHHRKIYKYINFIYPYCMGYQTFINDLILYTDSTPNQIGIILPYDT